ncbi:hypothetical protein ABMA28_006076 [Loxostege sticticalis]|uniref:DUF4746 domain-containing protein n=1 Tax=Loxostege sticticalis TaxID=481309 RepID=A0ABD0SKL5_LOXSC
MPPRKIELFLEIHDEKEFEQTLQSNLNNLICAEVYCHFAGWCTALDRLFTTMKLDWSDGKMVLLKVPADDIEALRRFRNQSEPVFAFILHKKITKVFRGVDALRLEVVAKKEIQYFKMELAGACFDRPKYELDEPTPDEMDWLTSRQTEKKLETVNLSARRAARQAARKRHRAELMVPYLQQLNFVLFWPHTHHAHFELYGRWDLHNIVMVGREELVLTKEKAEDVLYAGDAPINEASMFKLLSGPALAICFRMLDTDKHFVSLVRKILYEEIPPIDNEKPMNEQPPHKTAFDHYKSYSLSREQIWQQRREERMKRKEEEKRKRARHLSEMRRLARQAREEAIEAKLAEKEQRKLQLLKSGNLSELDKLEQEPDEEIDIPIPEELPEEVEEESEEEDEDEYFPPAGLLIPGFYAPPNDIAKANGLAILFPKLVVECVKPVEEFLPPHVLVMLAIGQRHTAIEAMQKHREAIIHMGIFKATTPFDAVHIAYSVNQYDKLGSPINQNQLRLVFMVSIKVDFTLLELMELNPLYVSRDSDGGEEECAAMFPVDYADEYPEFEDFGDHSVLKPTQEIES